jgi:hypothetical protein
MTNPYSEAFGNGHWADAGETVREALEISPSCISRWKKLRRETGGLKPGKMNGHTPQEADPLRRMPTGCGSGSDPARSHCGRWSWPSVASRQILVRFGFSFTPRA